MFLDFLTVFHMVWKNQENCESWLVGFGLAFKNAKNFTQQAFCFWIRVQQLP